MNARTISRWTLGTLALLLHGCETPPDEVEKVTQKLGVSGWPQGLVCGMGYYRNGQDVVRGFCQGEVTALAASNTQIFQCGNFCARGFHCAADGDHGLSAPWGLYHQAFNFNSGGVSAATADQLFLPRGTACGFKESCNNTAETCMGFDANVSCPAGWLKKQGSDMRAPSHCGFVWCEYQDPFNLCNGTCQNFDQPSGLLCGVTDNDRNNGQCLGFQTKFGCPPGWDRHGWFDTGRSPGHGIGWCRKP
jgi:hypothetical protein